MRFLLIALLCIPGVFAVTIQGSVYDFDLEPAVNSIVKIDSIPQQTFVARNGSFSFFVPPGDYVLSASFDDSSVEEIVIAESEGVYNIDLILFPLFDEDLSDVEVVDVVDVTDLVDDGSSSYWFFGLVGFVLVFVCWLFFRKKQFKPVPASIDDSAKQVLVFIDKEGGRTSQKDIRRAVPLSEAKISLILDDLESRSLVKRVKKGRSNVIIRV